jgi:hypothetical protein
MNNAGDSFSEWERSWPAAATIPRGMPLVAGHSHDVGDRSALTGSPASTLRVAVIDSGSSTLITVAHKRSRSTPANGAQLPS